MSEVALLWIRCEGLGSVVPDFMFDPLIFVSKVNIRHSGLRCSLCVAYASPLYSLQVYLNVLIMSRPNEVDVWWLVT